MSGNKNGWRQLLSSPGDYVQSCLPMCVCALNEEQGGEHLSGQRDDQREVMSELPLRCFCIRLKGTVSYYSIFNSCILSMFLCLPDCYWLTHCHLTKYT